MSIKKTFLLASFFLLAVPAAGLFPLRASAAVAYTAGQELPSQSEIDACNSESGMHAVRATNVYRCMPTSVAPAPTTPTCQIYTAVTTLSGGPPDPVACCNNQVSPKMHVVLVPGKYDECVPGPAPTATTPTGGATTNTNGKFVPLTNIPAIQSLANQDFSSANTLPGFLNYLYKIAIGAAAAIAVLQLVRAGIMYMGGDSVTDKKQAKTLIANTLLGLVVILSPAIVFGIINPGILNLQIGLSSLTPPPISGTASTPTSPLAQSICNLYTSPQLTQVPVNGKCDDVLAGGGWVSIDASCCAGTQTGLQQCCAHNPSYVPPAPTAGLNNGTFTFGLYYQDRDDLTGKACYAFTTSTFTDQAACTAAYNGQITIAAKKGPYAIGQSCTDAGQHSPTPADTFATLQKLGTCSQ